MKKNQHIGKHTFENSHAQERLVFGNFVLEWQVGILEFKGSAQRLTRKESELLAYFFLHPNQLIPRADVLVSVWGDDDYFMGRSMDVFISKLRKYLRLDPNVKIENIHGVGFVLQIN